MSAPEGTIIAEVGCGPLERVVDLFGHYQPLSGGTACAYDLAGIRYRVLRWGGGVDDE